jgi:putative hydrolase of the HAD superfamily
MHAVTTDAWGGRTAVMGNNGLKEIEGIAFDLDDTLYNKADWLVPALEHAARIMGMDEHRVWELATSYVHEQGVADVNIYNHVLLGCGQSDSALNIRAFVAAANTYKPPSGTLRLWPGVEDALSTLATRYRIGIVADGLVEAQNAKIVALRLSHFCNVFVLSDSIDGIRSRRPDPRPYRELLSQMGTRAARTLFVGDNPVKDFIRARQLGMLTTRVMTGEFAAMHYPSSAHAADYAISSVARLPELLE